MNFKNIDESFEFEQNAAIIDENIEIIKGAIADTATFPNEEIVKFISFVEGQVSTFGEKLTPVSEEDESIDRYNSMLYELRDLREKMRGREYTPVSQPDPDSDSNPEPDPEPEKDDEEKKNPTPKPNPQPGPGPDDNPEPEKNDESDKKTPKPDIEAKIKEFNDKTTKMEEDIRKILDSLTYEEKYKDTVEMVSELDKEFGELKGLADDLKKDIAEYRDNFGKENFKTSITKIDKKITEFRKKLREIKTAQRDQYNAKVNLLNAKMDELKTNLNNPNLDEEAKKAIEALTHMDLASGTYYLEGNLGYLQKIDYNKLLELTELTDKLGKTVGLVPDNIDLESDMVAIETGIKEVSDAIKPEMSINEVIDLVEKLGSINVLVGIFEQKLNNNKDKIAPEVFDAYESRLNNAKEEINRLRQELGKVKVPGKENSEYLGFQRELDMLLGQATQFGIRIGKESILEADLPRWEKDLDRLEVQLDEIGERIDKAYHDGVIDENHIRNLSQTYNEIKEKIAENRAKLHNPEVIKDLDDIFKFINDDIDALEKNIDRLEEVVNKLEKPIKDKKTRKQIEAIIRKLEEDIKNITANLEKYKDQDEEKYNAAKERLNKQEERLAKISKNYRKKCPLRVRAWKSAKEFYQKHKKIILIAAGLAAIALLAQPVIIPAIIQGNIMIGEAIPALSGITGGLNNILGPAIGAQVSKTGIWTLAGHVINPSYGMSSLLRGIAMSGIGSAALIAPVVAAIKALVEKMKKKEIKQKIKVEKEKKEKQKKEKKPKEKTEKKKITEKIKDVKNRGSQKIEELKKKKNKYTNIKEKIEWYGKYNASGLTKEEFVKQNNLPKDYIKFFIQMENSDMAEYMYKNDEETIIMTNEGKGR